MTSYNQIASICCASSLEFCLDYANEKCKKKEEKKEEKTCYLRVKVRAGSLYLSKTKASNQPSCWLPVFIGGGSSGLVGVTLIGKPKLMVAQ